jgi:hypothetical protein
MILAIVACTIAIVLSIGCEYSGAVAGGAWSFATAANLIVKQIER